VELPEEVRGQRYCLLTTNGRVTGRRHTAELWFVPAPGGVHLMSGSGGLTSWCLNLQAEEQGVLRIGDHAWLARAAFLADDDPDRIAVLDRFHERYDPVGKDRRPAWQRDATVVHMVVTRQL
jgi:deazaflavin-dependent oxidoreductase (nitroreductase family)